MVDAIRAVIGYRLMPMSMYPLKLNLPANKCGSVSNAMTRPIKQHAKYRPQSFVWHLSFGIWHLSVCRFDGQSDYQIRIYAISLNMTSHLPLIIAVGLSIIAILVVLGGELAVPSTRNPLYAGPNSLPRIMPEAVNRADRSPRNRRSRTSSGPEGSSDKWCGLCRGTIPVMPRLYCEGSFDGGCTTILRFYVASAPFQLDRLSLKFQQFGRFKAACVTYRQIPLLKS